MKKIFTILALGLMMMSLGAQPAQAATKDAVSTAKEQLQMYLTMVSQLMMVPMEKEEQIELQVALQDAQAVYEDSEATWEEVNKQIAILDAIAASHGQDLFDLYRSILTQQLNDLAEEGDNEECQKIIADAIALVNEQIGTYDPSKTFMENAVKIDPLKDIVATAEKDLEKARPKVYVVFDYDAKTMTYFYDNKYNMFNTNHRLYDPANGNIFKASSYVETAIIDASMKEAKLTSMGRMFYGKEYDDAEHLTNLTTIIGLENLNTENVTSMYCMFKDCESLEGKLDLSHFNTANVMNMEEMFRGCKALTEIDLRGFNVKNVEYMNSMFYHCEELTAIYSDSDWSKEATSLNESNTMFVGCYKLVGGNGTVYDGNFTEVSYAHPDEDGNPGYFSLAAAGSEIYAVFETATSTLTLYYDNLCVDRGGLTVDKWDELPFDQIIIAELDESMQYARPEDTEYWFYGYTNMTEIKHLNYLNTSEVTSMRYMFRECPKLTSLDLTSFEIDGTKLLNMGSMFFGCAMLRTIFCEGDWSELTASGSDMFYGCALLTGGNGTTYDSGNVNKAYARVDKDGAAGYFTSKKAWNAAKIKLKASIDDMNALYDFAVQYVPETELASFKSGIEALEAVYNASNATLPEVNAAVSNAQKALTDAIAAIISAGKTSIKDFIGGKLLPGDSEKCKTIIKGAQDQVDALAWNELKSVKKNIDLLNTAIQKILADVDAALAAERLATGMEQAKSQEPKANSQKLLRNGQLLILRDGKMYNVMGVEVK